MADVKELPKLPYSYDALEPYIDAKTMEVCAACTVHAAGPTSDGVKRCSKGCPPLAATSGSAAPGQRGTPGSRETALRQLLSCCTASAVLGPAPAAMCLLPQSTPDQQIRGLQRLICQSSYGMSKAAWSCMQCPASQCLLRRLCPAGPLYHAPQGASALQVHYTMHHKAPLPCRSTTPCTTRRLCPAGPLHHAPQGVCHQAER